MNGTENKRLFRVAETVRRNVFKAAEIEIAGDPIKASQVIGGLEGYLRSTRLDRHDIDYGCELLDAFYALPNPGDPRFCEYVH